MIDDLVEIARSHQGPPFMLVDGTLKETSHVLADALEAQAAEIDRLCAELAIARCNDMGDAWIAQKHAWQEAVEDALLQWCSAPSDDETPKDALRRLIQYEITAALDPAVSQAAADLVATAHREGMEEAAKRLEELHKNHNYDPESGTLTRKLGRYDRWPDSAKAAKLEHDAGYYRAIAEGVAHIRAAAGEVK